MDSCSVVYHVVDSSYTRTSAPRRWKGVQDARELLIRGATRGLEPILMAALAAGLALVPLALAAGELRSEIQAPMANVILFGLCLRHCLTCSSYGPSTCAS